MLNRVRSLLLLLAILGLSFTATVQAHPVSDLLQQPLAPGAVGGFNSNDHFRAIRVDNNSGSYLRVSTSGSVVPPFTLGFQEDFQVGAAYVELTPVVGPQGQPISSGGSTSYVSLYEHPQGGSLGQSNVSLVTPNLTATATVSVTPGGGNQSTAILAGIAGKRIVVTGISIDCSQLGSTVALNTTMVLTLQLRFNAPLVITEQTLTVYQPSMDITISPPITSDPGDGLSVIYNGINPGNQGVVVRVRYYLA